MDSLKKFMASVNLCIYELEKWQYTNKCNVMPYKGPIRSTDCLSLEFMVAKKRIMEISSSHYSKPHIHKTATTGCVVLLISKSRTIAAIQSIICFSGVFRFKSVQASLDNQKMMGTWIKLLSAQMNEPMDEMNE